jgi:hypothetical protein
MDSNLAAILYGIRNLEKTLTLLLLLFPHTYSGENNAQMIVVKINVPFCMASHGGDQLLQDEAGHPLSSPWLPETH